MWVRKTQVMKWRAQPANTPLVEQAPMALALGEWGWREKVGVFYESETRYTPGLVMHS